MLESYKSFIFGCFVGVFSIGFFWLLSSLGSGFSDLGKPQVFFEQEALKNIREGGLEVPMNVKTPYYYSDGFQDITCFISFVVPANEAEIVVQKFAQVGFSAFTPWSNQIADNSSAIREPGYQGREFETPYYDMDNLQDAIIYIDKSSQTKGFHFVYDRATQRLYFCSWDS